MCGALQQTVQLRRQRKSHTREEEELETSTRAPIYARIHNYKIAKA